MNRILWRYYPNWKTSVYSEDNGNKLTGWTLSRDDKEMFVPAGEGALAEVDRLVHSHW